jgi:hypothetical protein
MIEDDDKNKSRAELIFERDVARDVAECAMQEITALKAECERLRHNRVNQSAMAK